MILEVRNLILKEIKQIKGLVISDYLNSNYSSWQDNNKKIKLDYFSLNPKELEAIRDVARKFEKSTGEYYYKWLANKIDKLINIDTGNGDLRVKTLDVLPLAIKKFFEKDKYKVVFIFNAKGDETVRPYFINNVEYNPKNRHNITAYVSISFKYYQRGKVKSSSINIYQTKDTVEDILKKNGVILFDEELYQNYVNEYKHYLVIRDKLGEQMHGVGRSSNTRLYLQRDNVKAKIIIDDEEKSDNTDKKKESMNIDTDFWDSSTVQPLPCLSHLLVSDEEDEGDELVGKTIAPQHFDIEVFDLERHQYLEINSEYIEPYPWDETVIDKLILTDETKNLVEILIRSTQNKSEDIISGKMKGTIVIASGPPGVGKTLTAEVFSEYIKKPIYSVQCSQLGLNINSIEEKLKEILRRSSRWNCILLIDESDVYIRERGDDLEQNAIVGVFLRLIEYYQGIMFMTTNRGEIIDDAIMSRATAWIQYEIPDEKLSKEIWRVQSEQYNVKLTDKDIDMLMKKLNRNSGRSIRNLCKLVSSLEYDKKIPNVERILQASSFQKLEKLV